MKRLTAAEKTELGLIVVFILLVTWWLAPLYPVLTLTRLCLGLSVLLLCQSLLRDLWLLWQARRHNRLTGDTSAETTTDAVMCIESTVGAVGVLVGIILAISGFDQLLELSRLDWVISTSLVLGAGFFMKDWVFGWQPWRLQRGKEHANIIFHWKE